MLRISAKSIFITLLLLFCYSAYAGTCEMRQWCDLKRANDTVSVNLNKEQGNIYTCTLSVDGNKVDKHSEVTVRIHGRYGFYSNIVTLSAHPGGSKQIVIRGHFAEKETGEEDLHIKRLPDNSKYGSNVPAQIMCVHGDKR